MPPVRPFRGFRDTDSYGSGVFLASRDGGARNHLGRDLVTIPGDSIVAPFPCLLTRVGFAYPDGKMHLVEVEGTGEYKGWRSKILYVRKPETVIIGSRYDAGELIGVAEDLTAYYREEHPEHRGDITNHVHVELYVPVDVSDYFPAVQEPLRV